jgi:hypothetical protein
MLSAALAYVAFALVAIVLPGICIQRALRVPIDPALVLPVGMIVASAGYGLGAVCGWPWLLPLLVALLALASLARREPWRRAAGASLRGALAPCIAIVVFLALSVYAFDRSGPDGEFLGDPLESIDTTFHAGLVWELAQGYPPQVPGLAGAALHYHLGHPLLRAAALRWAGVLPHDLTHRYDVTLMALALVLALRGLAYRLGARGFALALVGFTPLLTDGSFVLGWLYPADWWADLLSSNVLLWLAFGNALIPALALLCAGLIALSRYEAQEGRGYLAVAVLGLVALPFFKVFLAVQALAGLVWAWVRTRRPSLLILLLTSGATCGLLVLGQASRTVEIVFDPLVPVARTAESLALAPTGVHWAAWVLAWVALAVGARVLGLRRLWTAFVGREILGAALAGTVVAGFVPGLLLRITFSGEGEAYNESTYFLMQSGALLWIFAILALGALRPALAGALVVLLALPSSAQFVVRRCASQPLRTPAPVVRAAYALQADSRPGAVVLEPAFSRFPPPTLVLAGRRLAFTRYIPYMAQFAPREWIAHRRALVEEFWSTSDAARARCIAEELGASHVFQFGQARLHFDTAGVLGELYSEGGARVYRVMGSGDACAGSGAW